MWPTKIIIIMLSSFHLNITKTNTFRSARKEFEYETLNLLQMILLLKIMKFQVGNYIQVKNKKSLRNTLSQLKWKVHGTVDSCLLACMSFEKQIQYRRMTKLYISTPIIIFLRLRNALILEDFIKTNFTHNRYQFIHQLITSISTCNTHKILKLMEKNERNAI